MTAQKLSHRTDENSRIQRNVRSRLAWRWGPHAACQCRPKPL